MGVAPIFLTLARKADLNQETAYAICQMIDRVGREVKEPWDWEWLQKKHKDYRKLIRTFPLEQVWDLLRHKHWLSFQRINDSQKPMTTIAPLACLTKLESLVLQSNSIRDLRPLSSLQKLKYLNCLSNKIDDLAPLKGLHLLEELMLGNNPIKSFTALEELPRLRELTISLDQIKAFTECRELPHLLSLSIYGSKGAIRDFRDWPRMPTLKLLHAYGVKNLSGIERFDSLETARFYDAGFSDLTPLSRLKALTDIDISASKAQELDLAPLTGLHALRKVLISGATVKNLPSLGRLPVLHQVHLNNKSTRNAKELTKLRRELTPWDAEFKAESPRLSPSLSLEVVNQDTFDYYDDRAPFGIHQGECNGGMFNHERAWLVQQLSEALSVDFEENVDFELPSNGGLRRSERLVLFSMQAYESFPEIATRAQRILCEMKNDWIIWCQSLLWEAPDEQDIPEGTEDFTVWIYPTKIVATKESAKVVRKLLAW